MCHEYTRGETANILDALAGLFPWRRRAGLAAAAAALRTPSGAWRPAAEAPDEPRGEGLMPAPAAARQPG